MPHSADRQAYTRDGFFIFRDLIPHADLPELRAMTEDARRIARATGGGQTQRIDPPLLVSRVDLEPYHRLRRGVGRDAVRALLGDGFELGYDCYAGSRDPWHYPTVLLEPAHRPWAIPWHRDWRDNYNHLPGLRDAWETLRGDAQMFTQCNWALYEDRSLWVVPGSHAREDTPAEAAVLASYPGELKLQFPAGVAEGIESLPPERQEAAWEEVVRAMPGALRVELAPGDLVIYRNGILHTGSYTPRAIRATLHDGIMTDAFHAWKDRWHACERELAARAG